MKAGKTKEKSAPCEKFRRVEIRPEFCVFVTISLRILTEDCVTISLFSTPNADSSTDANEEYKIDFWWCGKKRHHNERVIITQNQHRAVLMRGLRTTKLKLKHIPISCRNFKKICRTSTWIDYLDSTIEKRAYSQKYHGD